jgi:hypothetical protein
MTEETDPQAPTDRVDAQTALALARMADVDIGADEAAAVAAGLEGFLAMSDSWADLALGFRFEDGVFSYAQSAAQFRPEWTQPAALSKDRYVDSSGELASPDDDRASDA